MDDLIPAAVVEADVGLEALIPLGDLVRALHHGLQLRAEAVQLPKDLHADVVLLHGADGLIQILGQQLHDGAHFLLRPLPVLGGEGVDRQVLHADVLAVGGDFAEILRPHHVSRGAGQAAALGPAAVAIQYDGNMAGKGRPGLLPRRIVGHISHYISISSFSFFSAILSSSLIYSSVSFWMSFSAIL